MMSILRQAARVAGKDLRIELRSREIVYTMAFFAAVLVVVQAFVFPSRPELLQWAAPGMLWVVVMFAGTIGLGRAFDRERENDTMRALLLVPAPRLAVFLGKAAAIDAALDRVGLDARARDRAARTYSRGMVQRLALARALLTRPSLVLLDEPFTGLDRGGAIALGAELGALRDGGAIVVVVTHDLEAIAGVTDHVAVLREGKLVHEDRRAAGFDYDELKATYHAHAD